MSRRHGEIAAPPELDPLDVDDDETNHTEEMPRPRFAAEHALFFVLFVAAGIAFLYFVLPQIASLEDTWNRLDEGDPWWLAVALAATILSFAGYVVLFEYVYIRRGDCRLWTQVGYRESYQITMASLAATRLFAAGGAGGIALTAWALRRAGMRRRDVADRTVAFLVLTYLVYTIAVIVTGLGLRIGIFEGSAPFTITVVPAIVCAVLTIAGLSVGFIPRDIEERLEGWARRGGRLARTFQRLATVPASASSGIRDALRAVRSGDLAVLGAMAYWGFNIAILWAAFHAFGHAPPLAVIVLGYYVGMLGNLLPLPGGVGGVDGGMIGAFAALGVDVDVAIVAVLTYRGFAFWLPTIPGAIAYFQLRKTVEGWKAASATA